ncbi:MAG TPA: gephyrin-like molybdotransferase Glp [Alphaproteobacteria bacterium]|nr:gephyrin-like molybdotransferase Glp [Alphaproteobacteria bacterium]
MPDGPRPGLLPLDDALQIVDRVVKPVDGVETLPLERALGRYLAEPLAARRSLPPFDNSAVDGYAFRLTGQSRLRLIGESAAGIPYRSEVPEGAAVRISTGAVVPAGADTIAMQEDSRRENGDVVIEPLPVLNANLRRAGNDIAKGEIAFSAGHRLRPQDVALLRALGYVEAKVRRKLRVAIAPTGEELREGGADLAAGQIVETNGLMLAQLSASLPVDVTSLGTLPDNRVKTIAALADAAESHDLILTTGGVSVGDHDHVRAALNALGREHFWRLAIRPGKPVLFGAIDKAAFVGLPGNPVSAMVTFLLIALPALRALAGGIAPPDSCYRVPLAEPLKKPPTLRDFQRARLEPGPDGPRARPFRDQSSNLITSLAHADGLLDLPPGPGELQAGEMVTYRPFDGFFG